MTEITGFKFRKVVIVGAGGIGFHLTVALSRDIGHLLPIDVWDNDTFEGGMGARRLPHVSDPKQFKVNMLRDHIEWIMDDKPPTALIGRLTASLVTAESYWKGVLVVDCTDSNYEDRKSLWKALREHGATCLRVSYDGNGSIVVSPSIPFSTPSGAGGYDLVPSMRQSYAAGGLGAMAVVRALKTGKLTEMQVRISDKEED